MQKNRRKNAKGKTPVLFCFLAALLLVLILIFSFLAGDKGRAYYSAATPTATPAPLYMRVQGNAVRQLQKRLLELGYYQGGVDGDFGTNTQQAVMLFQQQHGLETDGVAGTQTQTLLYSDQAQPYRPVPTPFNPIENVLVTPAPVTPDPALAEMENVRKLQQALQTLGYYTGSIDGQYGSGTKEAVRRFQKQHDLAVDGIAGVQTEALLYSGNAEMYRPEPTPPPVQGTPAAQQTAVPALQQTENVPTPSVSLMSFGSENESVRYLQQRLMQLGYYTGTVDGQYGYGTKEAVEIFQKQHGLEADGAAGAKTIKMLWSGEAKHIVVTPKPSPVIVTGKNILILVNRENQLPEGFEPADLVKVKDIGGNNMLYADSGVMGVREAVVALNEMITAAKADGISPWKVREGYRTLKDQQKIFDNYVSKFMAEGQSRSNAVSSTRLTVADPGCSEHHTGLAFDLNANNPDLAFADTAQYVWLNKHCWEYGFIIRYTDEKEEITGFMGEEWHVRYVGKEHSMKMKELDMCLEEYLAWLSTQ